MCVKSVLHGAFKVYKVCKISAQEPLTKQSTCDKSPKAR